MTFSVSLCLRESKIQLLLGGLCVLSEQRERVRERFRKSKSISRKAAKDAKVYNVRQDQQDKEDRGL